MAFGKSSAFSAKYVMNSGELLREHFCKSYYLIKFGSTAGNLLTEPIEFYLPLSLQSYYIHCSSDTVVVCVAQINRNCVRMLDLNILA